MDSEISGRILQSLIHIIQYSKIFLEKSIKAYPKKFPKESVEEISFIFWRNS